MQKTKNKKLKISQTLFLLGFLMILGFFIFQEASAACLSVPASGNYTATTSCTFAGTVNGLESGNFTINSEVTLTINAGQTVVWNSGYSIIINGSIAINKGSPGGQLRKSYLWMVDADGDHYASSTASSQYYGSSAPTVNGVTAVSRSTMTSATFFDYDDRYALIYYGTACQSSSGSITDYYTDETKIATKSNITVSGGQVKSELSP